MRNPGDGGATGGILVEVATAWSDRQEVENRFPLMSQLPLNNG